MSELAETLNEHKARLLALPGCTGVAIGYKEVDGEIIDRLAIVVFFAKKQEDVAPEYLVPAMLDGVPTDVVEKTFGFRKLTPAGPATLIETEPRRLGATDPFARFTQLFSGISITPFDAPLAWGTLGCIIHTTGDPNHNIAPGNYLLTNHHVLWYADPNNRNSRSRVVIQPGNAGNFPPADYACGDYVYGVEDDANGYDCAIASIGDARIWRNEVPNHPLRPGRRPLTHVAAAAVGDDVYKYGATTQSTRGTVQYINYTNPARDIANAIYIYNTDGAMWVAQGDSGSVLIRYSDDAILGLNYLADDTKLLPPKCHPKLPNELPAYYGGFAYDIQRQMNVFGGVVILAPNG